MKKDKLAYRLAYAVTMSAPVIVLAALCPFRAPALGLFAVAGWLLFAVTFLPSVTAPLRGYFAASIDPVARRVIEACLIAAYWVIVVPIGLLGRRRRRRSTATTHWAEPK